MTTGLLDLRGPIKGVKPLSMAQLRSAFPCRATPSTVVAPGV